MDGTQNWEKEAKEYLSDRTRQDKTRRNGPTRSSVGDIAHMAAPTAPTTRSKLGSYLLSAEQTAWTL
jgi:hypothetical protein